MNITNEKKDNGEHLLSLDTAKLQNGIYIVKISERRTNCREIDCQQVN